MYLIENKDSVGGGDWGLSCLFPNRNDKPAILMSIAAHSSKFATPPYNGFHYLSYARRVHVVRH